MDALKYTKLSEVQGRLEAEMIESFLEAQGIDVELVQESVGHSIYPVTIDGLGKVEIFVPKEKAAEAAEYLQAYQDGSLQEDGDHE
jgi:hypothetical protein